MNIARGLFGAALWMGLSSSGWAAELGYYSQPALHGERLVFVCEGDLWTLSLPEAASEAPLIAHRLTSSDGSEANPLISPDGQWLAFSAQYDGNTDVYLMPIGRRSAQATHFPPSLRCSTGLAAERAQRVLPLSEASSARPNRTV